MWQIVFVDVLLAYIDMKVPMNSLEGGPSSKYRRTTAFGNQLVDQKPYTNVMYAAACAHGAYEMLCALIDICI